MPGITVDDKNRDWKPEKGRSFSDLSFQEKVEALTAGACNSMPKILTLMALSETYPQTKTELYDSVAKLYGRTPPFSLGMPSDFCRHSLLPIGAVVKGTVGKHGSRPRAFIRAREAELVFPIAVNALQFCQENRIALNALMGDTKSPGGVRRSYLVISILFYLALKGESTASIIAEEMGFTIGVLQACLSALANLNLIKYESVKTDSHGESEIGFSKAFLTNPDKAKELAQKLEQGNTSEFEGTPIFYRGVIMCGRYKLAEFLKNAPETIDVSVVHRLLGANYGTSSTIVGSLCKVGLYERGKIHIGRQSDIKITPLGISAMERVFLPVLNVAGCPDFACTDEFRDGYKKLSQDSLLHLLRFEEQNYVEHKLDPQNYVSSSASVLLRHIRDKFGKEPFRQKDVQSFFPSVGSVAIWGYLQYLLNQGNIEKITVLVRTARGEKTPRSGYYQLKTPEPR